MSKRDEDTTDDLVPGYGYPVVDSAELNPVTKRRFRRRRRALHEIPHQPPGSVLVFQIGGGYEVLPANRLELDADVLVDAVAVAVVSTRHVMRETVAYLPCGDPRVCIVLRAQFHCRVTDPQLVLDSGCWDIDPILADHLVADRRLRFMAESADVVAGWAHFHRNAMARIYAYHDLHPLVVPGIAARLVDIAVEAQQLSRPPMSRGTAADAGLPPVEVAAEKTAWSPPVDGNPAFMPDNYKWDES